jgi:hypothetical protein
MVGHRVQWTWKVAGENQLAVLVCCFEDWKGKMLGMMSRSSKEGFEEALERVIITHLSDH